MSQSVFDAEIPDGGSVTELRKDQDDPGTRRKGVKEPRKDMKKRARSSPGKAGADAQPRTGACADAATQETPTPAGQTHEHIARRAYALYEASGYRGEDALQHWLEAEREWRNNHTDDSAREI